MNDRMKFLNLKILWQMGEMTQNKQTENSHKAAQRAWKS